MLRARFQRIMNRARLDKDMRMSVWTLHNLRAFSVMDQLLSSTSKHQGPLQAVRPGSLSRQQQNARQNLTSAKCSIRKQAPLPEVIKVAHKTRIK